MSKKNKSKLPIIIFSFVLLFNPYIKVIDILPDFVAYFIFARLLERAADSAPYFEETRAGAVKLAWISLLKIPAFMLIVFIRSNNTLDNDVYAMATLIFAIVELIYLIPLINNLFSALFYLGERGNASSLITPFPISSSGKRTVRPEDLRVLAIIFAVARSVLSFIPELFLLSRTTASGVLMPAPMAKLYPISIIFSLVIVITLGIILLVRSIAYVRAISKEGNFTHALSLIASADSEKKYEAKLMQRKLKNSIRLLILAAIFAFPLALKNTGDVNIFPGFLFTAFSFFALSRLGCTKSKLRAIIISGSINAYLSVMTLYFSAKFHKSYDYIDLISNGDASEAYLYLMIFSLLELLSFVVYSIFAYNALIALVHNHTGLSPIDERYGKTEAAYHKSIKTKCLLFVLFVLTLSFLKCANVFINRNNSIIHSTVENKPVMITTSVLPWFGTLVCFFAIFFIGYTVYFARYLIEECEMKYSLE